MIKMSRSVTGQGGSFPVANNVLQRRWNQRNYEMHLAKKNGMKTKIDSTSPKTYPHLQVNMKKIQAEEERQALIDHDNRILLAKLTNIIRSGGGLDNWNFDYDTAPKSLNSPLKNREQERIEKENAALLKRLNTVKPVYNFDKLEDDYLMHNYFLSQKAQATKGYEVDVRGFEDPNRFIFYANDRHVNKEKTFVEGDIEETIEEPTEAEITELSSTKLPNVPGQKRLPTREHLRRRVTKLPLLGAERKKAEEKKKKEAAVKPASYSQKEEAAKLFKATKGMGNPEQILVQTLAKRTYQQRQDTMVKFEETYGLTLEQELKSNLSAEYYDIIDALLATREDLDAATLRRALKGEDSLVEPIIEILCTRSSAAIDAIRAAYNAKYSVSLEDDVTAEIKGKLRHLFLALAKGCRAEEAEPDEDRALRDAEALRDAGSEERWDASGGKMADLIRDASLVHLREVLQQYDKLTSSNLEKELKRTLFGDFKDAMLCLIDCLNSCTQYMAGRIHASLTGEADDTTLIRIIVTRSELDLPLIRRNYKRQFKQTLVESLEQRCSASYKNALVQMVVVHGAPQKPEEPKESAATGEVSATERPANSPKATQQKPLMRPAPNPNARVPSHNPLLRSTQQTGDPTRKTPGTPNRPSQVGARSKPLANVPKSPVKSRQAAGTRNGGGISTSAKKMAASVRKATPPKQPKATNETATRPHDVEKKDEEMEPTTKPDDDVDHHQKPESETGDKEDGSREKDASEHPAATETSKVNDGGERTDKEEAPDEAEMKSVSGSEKTESMGDQVSEAMSAESEESKGEAVGKAEEEGEERGGGGDGNVTEEQNTSTEQTVDS